MNDAEIVAQVITKLAEKYPTVPASNLERIVRDEFRALAQGSVRDYLGVLTERAVKERLKQVLVAA
ncbi:hypothetical protein BH11ACT3_BH11ACT3_23800 [soil metagenome]